MNCADFAEIAHELAREEARAGKKTLSAAAAVSARFHAQTCEVCAVRLAEAQSLAVALKAIAEDSAHIEAPAHVEMSLMAALREHHRSRERARFRERRWRWRWAGWATAVAAATILLAMGARNLWQRHSPSVHVANTNPVAAAVKTNAPSAQAAGPQQTAAEDSDFVPLPYGESLSADDSGVVVRVSMTRDALATLGYPVDEGRGEDVVQADLIVGEDGWPRAVRLVP